MLPKMLGLVANSSGGFVGKLPGPLNAGEVPPTDPITGATFYRPNWLEPAMYPVNHDILKTATDNLIALENVSSYRELSIEYTHLLIFVKAKALEDRIPAIFLKEKIIFAAFKGYFEHLAKMYKVQIDENKAKAHKKHQSGTSSRARASRVSDLLDILVPLPNAYHEVAIVVH